MNEKRFNLYPEIHRVIGICHIETGGLSKSYKAGEVHTC